MRRLRPPTNDLPESVIKRQCVYYLQLQKEFFGWVEVSTGIFDPTRGAFRKRSGFGMINGVSDVIGLWNGRGLACEIKTPKGRLTDPQKEFLKKYEEKGGVSCVLRSVDDCVRLVESLRLQTELPVHLTKGFR